MEKKKISGFQIILIALTVVLAGGALVLGFLQKSAFGKNTQAYNAKLGQVSQMKSMAGAPRQETVDQMTDSLKDYQKTLDVLQKELSFAEAPEFKNVKPAEFSDKVTQQTKRLKAAYAEKGVRLPADWHLGFEKYSSVLAPQEATGVLLYQLDALVWLHEELLKVQPDGLVNLYRKPISLEVESGESAINNRQSNRAPEKTTVTQHPIELSFISREPKARAFINEILKSKKFLFTVDTVKLQEVTVEDSLDAVEEEESDTTEDAASVFDAIFSEDEGEEEDVPLSNEKLFTQVLGKERVAVFIDLNLSYLTATETAAPAKK